MNSKTIIFSPLDFPANANIVVQHDELPLVTNELSVTLRLNLQSHNPGWIDIFQKGEGLEIRSPSLWLTPNVSQPTPRFSTNIEGNSGISAIGDGFILNKWYHISYTLSEPHKRADFYVDGKWVGFKSIEHVQTQYIVFNKEPLKIGQNATFTGRMRLRHMTHTNEPYCHILLLTSNVGIEPF
ncbi:5326_t:CDS:2 [Ambispora gerdemannii]|uniref:5326_t:CDS:1 n=1 Tax=Ambispora gerdemannii TaxID=144530 RepID=A0A9N9BLB4_9GLOM|nr:5326_t:CDS:2 [Ambispora gerdemannii]